MGKRGPKGKSLSVRFWAKVCTNGPMPKANAIARWPDIANTRCWEWIVPFGRYPMLGIGGHDGPAKTAGNVAWYLATGEWPAHQTCHKCDNPACARFSHLFEGTPRENTADCSAKGRRNNPKHAKHWNTKLTECQVLEIRAKRKLGIKLTALATHYGVSFQTISKISLGDRWQ